MTTKDEAVLYMIKGALSDLSEQDQAKVRAVKEELKAVIDRNGEHGMMALALLGAEMSAEESA